MNITEDSTPPTEKTPKAEGEQLDEPCIPVSEVEHIVDDLRKTASNGMFEAQRRTAQRYVEEFEELIEEHTTEE